MAGSMHVTRIEMNRDGARALLQGPEVQGLLTEMGEAIADTAGGAPDFDVQLRVGSARARVTVMAVTEEGRRAEAEDRRLSMAVGSARG